MTLFELLIRVLAVWRICGLSIQDRGPYRLLDEWRRWAGCWLDEFGATQSLPGSFGDMVTCLRCLSLVLAYATLWVPFEWMTPLAVSQGVILAQFLALQRK